MPNGEEFIMPESVDYTCSSCGVVMEEEPDYEFSGLHDGCIGVFCSGCVLSGVAFDFLRRNVGVAS